MSYEHRHNKILENLDSSVHWTGIPELAQGHPRRRPLRWLSAFALVLAILGFVVDLGLTWGWGYALLMLGFCLSSLMPVWGPLKPWGGLELADELDRLLRTRAYLVALTALGAVAVFGLLLIVGLSALQGWPVDILRWTIVKFAFLLGTIYSAGPTCYASWAQAPISEDD